MRTVPVPAALATLAYGNCDVAIVLLAGTEYWRCEADARILPIPSGADTVREDPDAWTLVQDGWSECRDMLDDFVRAAADRHIVLAISPEPASVTATGSDILVASGYQKSALRVACELVSRAQLNVTYWPLSDGVFNSEREAVWQDDLMTLRPEAIAEFVAALLEDLALASHA